MVKVLYYIAFTKMHIPWCVAGVGIVSNFIILLLKSFCTVVCPSVMMVCSFTSLSPRKLRLHKNPFSIWILFPPSLLWKNKNKTLNFTVWFQIKYGFIPWKCITGSTWMSGTHCTGGGKSLDFIVLKTKTSVVFLLFFLTCLTMI